MLGADLGMAFIDSRILIFSFLLFCVSAVPCLAKYGGGEGTAEEPYLIYTAEQLNQIGLNDEDWGSHFALMDDIDLDMLGGADFNMIGDFPLEPFTGVFDGRGHVIYNFFNYSVGSYGIGLFRYVEGQSAQIKNLGLINPHIFGGSLSVAPLVGMLEGQVTVSNCWVVGGYVSGARSLGGLVGTNGWDKKGGTISNCYSQGDVETLSGSTVGGLVGSNKGVIENCYFAGQVWAQYDAGAIVGEDAGGTYAGCFWDKSIAADVNGVGNLEPDPCGVIGETTANMQTATTFIDSGWDMLSPTNMPLVNIWRMCEDGLDYPRLAVEFSRADFDCPDGVGLSDLAVLAGYWLLVEFDDDVDFNRDKIVNMKDWGIFAAAWGSTDGDGNYNTDVDIVSNGKIDEYDLSLFIDYWLMRGSYYLKADIESYEGDGIVNGRDYAVFASEWLGGD